MKCDFKYDPFANASLGKNIDKLKCVNCDLVYYNPAFFGDDDFYERISHNNWYYENEKWEFSRALEIIAENKPKTLLEIGCGKGLFLDKVYNAVEYAEGIEINEEAIQFCKSKNLNVSNKKLTDFTSKIDMIVSFEVFEHLDNISYFVEKSLELLSDNGILLIAVPNPNGYFKEMDIVLLDLPPHHNLGFTKKTFDYMRKKYNLNLVHYDCEPLRYVHYMGYMYDTIQQLFDMGDASWKSKIIKKIKLLVFNFLSTTSFVRDREKIIGQTHLVVFQKGKQKL